MAARPLSEREVLPYLVVFVALSVLASCIPHSTENLWDYFGVVWSLLLAVFGTIYIYQQNGGAGGQHFLQRYLAVGWLVAMRCLVFFIFVGVAYYGILTALEAEAENTQWHDFLFYAVVEVVFYWRTGHHVRDLARKTTGL